MKKNKNEEWLKGQCNRYVNGQCNTLKCLTRGNGGKRPKASDYNLASCEAHEVLLELEELRDECKSMYQNFCQARDEY